jgi:hypothetical protein
VLALCATSVALAYSQRCRHAISCSNKVATRPTRCTPADGVLGRVTCRTAVTSDTVICRPKHAMLIWWVSDVPTPSICSVCVQSAISSSFHACRHDTIICPCHGSRSYNRVLISSTSWTIERLSWRGDEQPVEQETEQMVLRSHTMDDPSTEGM